MEWRGSMTLLGKENISRLSVFASASLSLLLNCLRLAFPCCGNVWPQDALALAYNLKAYGSSRKGDLSLSLV